MCICICLHCVFLAAVDFKMGVDSWLDRLQLPEQSYEGLLPLEFLFIPDFLISASSHANIHIVRNLHILSLKIFK